MQEEAPPHPAVVLALTAAAIVGALGLLYVLTPPPLAPPGLPHFALEHAAPVGARPEGVYFDAQSGVLYVANPGSRNISLVNATTFRVAGTIATGQPVRSLTLDSISGSLVGGSATTPNLTLVDPTTHTLAGTVGLREVADANGVEYDPSTGQLFVVDAGDSTLLTLDAASYVVTARTALEEQPGGGEGFAINSTSHQIYFPDAGTNSVQVIDERTGVTVGNLSLPGTFGPTASFFDPWNALTYFTMGGLSDHPGNRTDVVNLATGELVGTIPVAAGPAWSAYDPVRHLIYVTGADSSSVSVISDLNNSLVATIRLPLGSEPSGIAVNLATGVVYVAAIGLNELLEVQLIASGSIPAPTGPLPVGGIFATPRWTD